MVIRDRSDISCVIGQGMVLTGQDVAMGRWHTGVRAHVVQNAVHHNRRQRMCAHTSFCTHLGVRQVDLWQWHLHEIGGEPLLHHVCLVHAAEHR